MKAMCPSCGVESEGGFCSKCGAPLSHTEGLRKELSQREPELFWTEKCPVCQSGCLKVTAQKKLFGLHVSVNLTCNNCSAVFVPDGDKYKLTDVTNKLSPVWQKYNQQSLSTKEWKRISCGGMSDAGHHQADMEQYMTSLRDGDTSIKLTIEGGSSSVVLKENEELQILLPNMALREARRATTTTGAYGGPSFRVAKGVYFRTGVFGSESHSHDELKEIDRGRLMLTNKRLIFTGAKRTSETSLTKIIAIEPYSNGIAVEASGRSKTQCFVGIDPNRISIKITINERSYSEPFTGLMLKYMIEGLVKQQQRASKQSARKPQPQKVAKGPDIPEQIRKLGELRDAGIITAEEFEKKKAELLARM